MESPVINLYNQFQLMRAQMDGLNESVEPRELLRHLILEFIHLCLTVW